MDVCVFDTGSLGGQTCLSFPVFKESVVCVEVSLTGSPSAPSVADIIV
jgi:hypothetical protein